METTMEIKKKIIKYYQQNKQEFLCDFDIEDEYAYDEWIEDFIMTSDIMTSEL